MVAGPSTRHPDVPYPTVDPLAGTTAFINAVKALVSTDHTQQPG